eukprot:GHVH01006283.1.p1 GENE.GHVH01006283.1~~GHVH01006283.1.p1  ORF type:complete len:109 (+),score=4.43 GHVH01006283.1:530-856(+)
MICDSGIDSVFGHGSVNLIGNLSPPKWKRSLNYESTQVEKSRCPKRKTTLPVAIPSRDMVTYNAKRNESHVWQECFIESDTPNKMSEERLFTGSHKRPCEHKNEMLEL